MARPLVTGSEVPACWAWTWAGPKTWFVVPGTDHNTLSGPDAYWTAVAAFLARVR